ncbi:MAG: response regulator [Bacteroidetes bacterium]|nr:MAG: response regulator [Bacteroidota bacterium]
MNTKKNKTRLLLIEDNSGDVGLIKIYLQEAAMKYELFVAETFYEGAEILRSKEVDLVLLDLTLPDTTGFKTLTKYLESFSNVPVIVLTGLNNEIIGNQAIRAGAQDFLVKGQIDGKLLGRSIRYSLHRFKTQLKLRETAKELEINKKRYIEAQEMAHFGNWEMDIVTNEMKWTDEVFRIFNFRPGSLQPTFSDYLKYVHIEDRAAVENFFETVTKDGQLHKMEHRLIVDGKNLKYVILQAKVYYDDLTDKLLLVGVIQDVTERKLSEKLIIEKNISNKADRIKEEAFAEMGFHIRTPLSSIVNLLYLLENTRVSVAQKDYIAGLKTSVDDLSIAINNLLNFSVLVSDQVRIESEEFDIREFMQRIQQVVKLKADNAKLDLRFETDPQLPTKLIGDPKKITQILYNLLDNAIKYTPEGGKIEVLAKGTPLQSSNIRLTFTIKDTGRGIPSGKIKDLLKPDRLLEIYTEDRPDSGTKKTQLGIAISNKLSQTLGGEMHIESNEKEGTTVSVSIPMTVAKQTRMLSGNAPEVPLKILLVEDHFLNQIATKKVLTTWSELVSVDIADNGLVGVEKFKEHGYDLILMDIQMPVMNGLEAARKIREFSDVPIIALTANSTKQEQDKAFEVGINDYLAKPFKPHELYAKIMNLISFVLN